MRCFSGLRVSLILTARLSCALSSSSSLRPTGCEFVPCLSLEQPTFGALRIFSTEEHPGAESDSRWLNEALAVVPVALLRRQSEHS